MQCDERMSSADARRGGTHDEDVSHLELLDERASILDGQDERKGRRVEGALVDHFDHGAEADLAGERAAVVDNGRAVVAVPHVELHAATALAQRRPVDLGRRLALELMAGQIRVVRRAYVVERDRVVHAVIHHIVTLIIVVVVRLAEADTVATLHH